MRARTVRVKSWAARGLGLALLCASAAVLVGIQPAVSAAATEATAVEPASCKTVRLSDIGWTDVTATTATVGHLLTELGYDARITVLSLPVTYAAMKNKDIDVFLGNWMPSQEGDANPLSTITRSR